jgi:hypothetical protein
LRCATPGSAEDGSSVGTRYPATEEAAVLERLALIDLAGVATEQEITPCEGDIKNAMAGIRKIVLARDGADPMTAVEVEVEVATLFAQLGYRAAALVDDNRDLIDSVARALLDRGELTGDQVDAIMGRCA